MFILAIKNLKFYLKYLFQIKPQLNKHWKLKIGGLYTSFGATVHLISYCCTENATCTKIAFSSTCCYWNKPCHEIQIYSKITIKKKSSLFLYLINIWPICSTLRQNVCHFRFNRQWHCLKLSIFSLRLVWLVINIWTIQKLKPNALIDYFKSETWHETS